MSVTRRCVCVSFLPSLRNTAGSLAEEPSPYCKVLHSAEKAEEQVSSLNKTEGGAFPLLASFFALKREREFTFSLILRIEYGPIGVIRCLSRLS